MSTTDGERIRAALLAISAEAIRLHPDSYRCQMAYFTAAADGYLTGVANGADFIAATFGNRELAA